MNGKPMLSVDRELLESLAAYVADSPNAVMRGRSVQLRALLDAQHVVCSNGILCQNSKCAECGGNGAYKPAAQHQGEPVAYRWRVKGHDNWTVSTCKVEFDARANDDRFVAKPLYAEQLASVAVVMPDKINPESLYPDQADCGWNDCIDEMCRLNGVKP